jgi:Protein kinase domain
MESAAPIQPGTRLGRYEVRGFLGEGGMGRVYLAQDADLGRQVALKLLRPRHAQDEEWVRRFEREARLLASLKHDHIATLYSIEKDGGLRILVMELVEGPTLADLIEKGPLSLEQSLPICAQIAEAVEFAHSRGVVHRDLKPANVKIASGGQVKVLDFGLAKAVRAVETAEANDRETTEYHNHTKEGTIVGTPAYMSPEQARGLRPDSPADEATFYKLGDTWAFGCILYECLTGRPAFSGGTMSDVLAVVLKDSPDWAVLSSHVPPRITTLIRRCLQKDPQRRHHCLADARLEIEEALEEWKRPHVEKPISPPSRRLRVFAATGLAAALALACFGLGWWTHPAGREASPPVEKPTVMIGLEMLDGSTSIIGPRISPNGEMLAYGVLYKGQTQVGVMNLKTGKRSVQTGDTTRGMINCLTWRNDEKLYFDRFFDRPIGIYAAFGPGGPKDKEKEEPVFTKDAECPETLRSGAVFFCRPDGKGRSRFYIRKRGAEADTPVFAHPVELTAGWPPPAIRALRNSEAVIFCGTVFDPKDPAPKRYYYRLDIEKGTHHKVYNKDLSGSAPIAVSLDDKSLYTVLPEEDMFSVVRLPLSGGENAEPETIWPLSNPVISLEADKDEQGHDRLYLVPSPRPRELLKITLQGGRPEPLGSVLRNNEIQPVELPDGRLVRPCRVLGRDRLSLGINHGFPEPVLAEDDRGETRPPAAFVPPNYLAFVYQERGQEARLRLATIDLEAQVIKDVPEVETSGLTGLTSSVNGQWLYYVRNRELYKIKREEPRGKPERLAPDYLVNSVAVHPKENKLLVQRYGNEGVNLAWVPLDGGKPIDIKITTDSDVRLAPSPLSCRAIDSQGRILKAVATPGSWFWQLALITLDKEQTEGKVECRPWDFEGDFWLGTWSRDEKHILAIGHPFRTELWRLERRK